MILSCPEDKVAKAAFQRINISLQLEDKSWREFDFGGVNKFDGKAKEGISAYGSDIFRNSRIARDENCVWIVRVDESTFIEKIFDRWHTIEPTQKLFDNNHSLVILWINKREIHEVFLKVRGKLSREELRKIAIWEVDFLPTFMHLHFGERQLFEEEGQEDLLDQLILQRKEGLWNENDFELRNKFNSYLKNGNGKYELAYKIIELTKQLKEGKKPEDIIKEKKAEIHEKIISANVVEKVIAHLIASMNYITVNDLRLLVSRLLHGIEVEKKVEEEYFDTENLLKKRMKVVREPGYDYFVNNSFNIFSKFSINDFEEDDGSRYLQFSENLYKEELSIYFERRDPVFHQNQFDKIKAFAESVLIYTPFVSETLAESIIKMMTSMAIQNTQIYGLGVMLPMLERIQRIILKSHQELIDLFTEEKDELDPEKFQEIIEKIKLDEFHIDKEIAYGRLAQLILEMLETESQKLRELVHNAILWPLASLKEKTMGSDILFSLLKRLDHSPKIDPLIYIKLVLNSQIASHDYTSPRFTALRYLVKLGKRQGSELSSFLEKLKSWLPETEYKEFQQANAKRAITVFFFVFADSLIEEKNINEETLGNWPSPYVLFRNLPEAEDKRAETLELYIDWLFHAGFIEAVGHWVFNEYDFAYWEGRITSQSDTRNAIDRINYVNHLARKEDQVDSIFISNRVTEQIINERIWILEVWMLILMGTDLRKASTEGREISSKLIELLHNKLDKGDRNSLLDRWRSASDELLELAAGESEKYSRKEKKFFSTRRKVYKHLIKEFKQYK